MKRRITAFVAALVFGTLIIAGQKVDSSQAAQYVGNGSVFSLIRNNDGSFCGPGYCQMVLNWGGVIKVVGNGSKMDYTSYCAIFPVTIGLTCNNYPTWSANSWTAWSDGLAGSMTVRARRACTVPGAWKFSNTVTFSRSLELAHTPVFIPFTLAATCTYT